MFHIHLIKIKFIRLKLVVKNNTIYRLCEKAFLSIFDNFKLTETSNYKMKIFLTKKGIQLQLPKMILIAFLFTFNPLTAQWGSWGSDEADTTENSDSSDGGGWDDDWGGAWGNEKSKSPGLPPPPPPYERFSMPMDTITNLVTYTDVIEDESCDYCTPDSLYYRAKQYLLRTLFNGAKDFPKNVVVENVLNERIILTIRTPVVYEANTYRKFEFGEVEFSLQLRFKDYRYKYKFTNFVHITPVGGASKEYSRTYFEYYLKAEKRIKTNDRALIATDKMIRTMINELITVLKDPATVDIDEDDF
jgi:hypothetical protein